MTETSWGIPPIPADPGLPTAPGLLGPEGAAAVAAFLEGQAWRMEDARPVQCLYRPGRSCLVRYRVRATSRRGQPRVLSITAEARARERPPVDPPEAFGARYELPHPVADRGGYLVWAFPYDPSLEGLPRAAWGPAVRQHIAREDVPVAVSVEPVRYRPRRRAVFRYVALQGGRRKVSFGKVLRPGKAERWGRGGARRRLPFRRPRLRLAVPSAVVTPDMLVVPAVSGESLRALLLAGGALPAPERVAAILDDVPREVGAALGAPKGQVDDEMGPDHAGMGERAAEMVARLVPDARGAAMRVAEAAAVRAGRDHLPPRLVHGDLYEAQVFVGPSFGLGLIDLDDAGPGDPAMDAANFCAHLVALALSMPAAADRLLAYRGLVREAFARRLDVPVEALAWREAVAMLALATGPFRVLHPAWPREVRRRAELAVLLTEPGTLR